MVKHFHQSFGILLTETFVFSSLGIHLSVSVGMHRYMFYTLPLTSILLYFFPQIVPALTAGNSFNGFLCPLILIDSSFYTCIYLLIYMAVFWEELFMTLQEVPGSSCIFPAPALDFRHF